MNRFIAITTSLTPILIIFLSVSCGGILPKRQSQSAGVAAAAPSPSVQAIRPPAPMTVKERWERAKELLAEDPQEPEELIELREHLTAVASSKIPERHRAARALKILPTFEEAMPTGEKLERARRICKDLTGPDVGILTDALKKTLHDPASLQDFEVQKCAPLGPEGATVHIRAGYRAKNQFGALTLNQKKFLAVQNTKDGPRYKAVVLPD